MKSMFATVLVACVFASPVLAQHSTAVVLSEGTSQAHIDAEVLRLRQQRRESYQGLNCNSDFKPVDMEAFCWASQVPSSNGANVNAGALGASSGGSD
jgi:hypothetical protein